MSSRNPTRRCVAALVCLVGCGTNEESSTVVSVDIPPNVGESGGAPDPSRADGAAGPCEMTMPGELMAQADAHIRFSDDRVCPGYVTITAGMFVTFTNESESQAEVSVTALDTSAVIWTATIDSDESVEHTFTELGSVLYSVSALPTFSGTIEIRASE